MSWEVTANHQRFDEAVDWFRQRVPYTAEQYGQLDATARRNAFWVGGGVELSAVQTIFDEIGKSLEKGTSLEEFKKAIRAKLGDKFGSSGHHIETVFRNATQTSYNTARWYQLTDPDIAIGRPYLLYDAILDGKTTVECKTLNGTVKAADDPWWLTHWCPLHHRCRSSARSLTRREAMKRGITEGRPDVKIPDGFGLAPPVRGEAPPKPDLTKVDPAVSAVYKEREAQMQRELAAAQAAAAAARQKQDPKHWFEREYKDAYGEDAGRAIAWGRAMEERGKTVSMTEAKRQYQELTGELGIITNVDKEGLYARLRQAAGDGVIPKKLKSLGEVVDALDAAVQKDGSDKDLKRLHAEVRALAGLIGHRQSIKAAGKAVAVQAEALPAAAPPKLKERAPTILEQVSAFWAKLSDASLVLPDKRLGYKIRWVNDRGLFDHVKRIVRTEWATKGAALVEDGHRIIIHEFGHGVEHHNDRQRRAAHEFLQRRTVGEGLESLRKLTGSQRYATKEMTRKDGFPDWYMGKEYVQNGRRWATEITSMVFELLREDTAKLVQSDDESFWFGLGQLAGENVQ